MKIAGIVALVFIGFAVLSGIGMALNIITIPWLKLGSQVNMEGNIITKTYNADNAIYNYHWFQERLAAIKATENKVGVAIESIKSFESSAGARKDWSFEDKNEDARLRAVAQGLKSQYEDLTNEYNARAKEVDRNIFQNGLPLIFSLKPFAL